MSALSYGNSLRDSVINSIQTLWIQETVNAMITLHCLLTVTLVINPLNQSAEDLFKIPQGIFYFVIQNSATLSLEDVLQLEQTLVFLSYWSIHTED